MKRDMKINGSGTIATGDYGKIKIKGAGHISGDISFDELSVKGSLKSDGTLTGSEIKNSGSMVVEGNVKVKRFIITGVFKSEDYKIYSDEIKVSGMLKNQNEINADQILIEGGIEACDVFGDIIEINYQESSLSKVLRKLGNIGGIIKHNVVKNMECNTLHARKLTCETLSAENIKLAHNCVITTISCNGSLEYDESCQIGTIEGDCKITKVEE